MTTQGSETAGNVCVLYNSATQQNKCVRDLWGSDAWLCTHSDVWASNLSLVSISPLSDAMQHY